MKNYRRVTLPALLILLTMFIFFSISCNTSEKSGETAENEAKTYIGYVYVPADEGVGDGLTAILSSTPPDGYNAVKGAKIYPENQKDVISYSNSDGQFTVDFDSFTKRSNGNNEIQIIIEPPAELGNYAPIRHTVAPWGENDNYKKIILHPNSRNIKIGQVIQLQVMGVLEGNQNEFIEPSLLTWHVNNESIGTIDSQGVFKGLKTGTATVTATYNSLSCTGKVFIRGSNDDSFTLSGVVTDQDDNPISNAVVMIDVMDSIGITSSNGKYRIPGVPGNTDITITVLVNGQIGYSSVINLTGDTTYDIVISESAISTGSLKGAVTSKVDNLPIKEVLVTIGDLSTTTDGNGSYLMENIPAGTCSVNFDKSGYISSVIAQEIETSSIATLNVIMEKDVSTTGGTIKGRVLDQSGSGISNAQVSYESKSSWSSLISGFTIAKRDKTLSRGTATTDSQGNFTFQNVPAGDYRVTASKEGYGNNYADATVVAEKETNIIITLYPLAPSPTISPSSSPSPTSTSVPSPTPLLSPYWINAGSPGFTTGGAVYTSLFVYCGTPYVAFKDDGNDSKASLMKYDGTNWVNVGNAGFSAGTIGSTKLFINNSGTPYVAYTDYGNGGKATVMKYNGANWVNVGNPGFSTNAANWPSIAIDDSGTPYVCFTDVGLSNKATVMKYDGSDWVCVGAPGFSAGAVGNGASFFVTGSGVPYITYKDGGNGGKISAMMYDGSNWVHIGNPGFSEGISWGPSIFLDSSGTPYVAYNDETYTAAVVAKFDGSNWVFVGNPGFSAGSAGFLQLFLNSSNTPYVAYRDAGNGLKMTVMKYDGTNWVNVGNAGFSADVIWHPSLFIDNTGTPYVAYRDTAYENNATVMKFGMWPVP